MTERDNLIIHTYTSSSDDENNVPPATATQGWQQQQHQAQTSRDADEVINLDESSSPNASPTAEVIESTTATSAVEQRRAQARIDHNLFWSAIGNPERINSWPKPGGTTGLLSRLSRATQRLTVLSAMQNPRAGALEARPGARDMRQRAQDTRPGVQDTRPGAQDTRPGAQDTRQRQCRTCARAQDQRPGAIEARPGVQGPRPGVIDTRPGAQDPRPGVIESRSGAMETSSGAHSPQLEAQDPRPEVISPRPGVIEARPGVIEARPGVQNSRPEAHEVMPALFGRLSSAYELRPLVPETRSLVHEPVPELSQPQPQPSASADMMSINAFRRLQRYRTYRRHRASSLGAGSRLPPLDQSRESSPRAGDWARLVPVTVDVTYDRGVVSSTINYPARRESTRSRTAAPQGAERQRPDVSGAERPRSALWRGPERHRPVALGPERPRSAPLRGPERPRSARTRAAAGSQEEGAAQNDAQDNGNEQSGDETESGRLSPRLPVPHEESQDNSDNMEVDEPNTSSPREEAGDGEDESDEELTADISVTAPNGNANNEQQDRGGRITIDIRRARGSKRRRESERQRTEAFNLKEFNQNLLRLLECPVCLEWMEPPMLQCRLGHLVCMRCRARLTTCPVCRSGFSSVRNRAMEGVAELLRYPCRHGCGRLARLRRRATHEASCPRRRYGCPAHACADRAPLAYDELVMHVQRSHAAMIKTGRTHKFSVKVNAQQNDNWLIMAGFGLFNLRIAVDTRASSITAYVAYIGPKCRAKEFLYSIKIVGQHNGRKLLYSRTTHSDLESSSLNVSRQDCFHITLDEAINFLRIRNRHCQPDRLLDLNVEIAKHDETVGGNNSVMSDE